MKWGDFTAWVAQKRFERARRRDRRPRRATLGDASASWLGVESGSDTDHVARDVDGLLADRLSRSGALVVAVGESLVGTTSSVVHAARQVLKVDHVVAPGRTVDVDVADLVELAAASIPAAPDDGGLVRPEAVVWLDGAPLAVLDQLVPATLDRARDAHVRMVVTTRPELVGADHPDPATAVRLREATVFVGPLTESEAARGVGRAGEPIGRAVAPGVAARAFLAGEDEPLARAVAMAAATWEVLGVPLPLTAERLVVGVRDALDRLRVRHPGVDAVREAVSRCVRGAVAGTPVLVATRLDGEAHLRAHPAVLDAAMAGCVPLARRLRKALGADAALVVARTALARGDDVTAAELLRGRPAAPLRPEHAVTMACHAENDTIAASWCRQALTSDDPDLLLAVRLRLAGLLWGNEGDRDEVRRLLTAAAPDQRALVALGRLESEQGRRHEAREAWTAAARGADAVLAAEGAWRAGRSDLEIGHETTAVPLLEQAFAVEGGEYRGRAGLALARVRRRRGELDRAEELARVLAGETGPRFDAEVRDGATLELGLIAEARGDEATATKRFAMVADDPEAACLLAEGHLRAGRLREAFDAVERSERHRSGARGDHYERWGTDVPDFPAWWAWIVAQIAEKQGRRGAAWSALDRARTGPGLRGRRAAVRLAELAADARDALVLHRCLSALPRGGDEVDAVAQRLREEHADLLARGAQLAAEQHRAVPRTTRALYLHSAERIWLERERAAFDRAERAQQQEQQGAGAAETVPVYVRRVRRALAD